MKLISLAALSLLLSLSLLAASPHKPKDAKITRNEAQHIALKRYPGGRVTTAKLETVQGILVWSIEITPSNAQPVTVAVDATTGLVDPAKMATR
jgi:Predicted membrane protein